MPPPPNHIACSTPNPPWWCEQRPNHPHCKDVVETPIDGNIGIGIVFALILGIIYLKRFRQKYLETL